jgi:hypothetical protein
VRDITELSVRRQQPAPTYCSACIAGSNIVSRPKAAAAMKLCIGLALQCVAQASRFASPNAMSENLWGKTDDKQDS